MYVMAMRLSLSLNVGIISAANQIGKSNAYWNKKIACNDVMYTELL